jgi:hypothetical protein
MILDPERDSYRLIPTDRFPFVALIRDADAVPGGATDACTGGEVQVRRTGGDGANPLLQRLRPQVPG